MTDQWVIGEMESIDLQEKRLNNCLREVLSQLAAQPTASIPAACGGRAEMVRAYDLFENEMASFEKILAPHADATRKRMAAQPVVVLAQDTTELELTRPQSNVNGAGPLDGKTRGGAFLQPLHAFTPDGTPLGTLWANAWVRSEETVRSSLSQSERAQTPIEGEESFRWIETLRQARIEAQQYPSTQVICVADSEADIDEFLVEAMQEPGPSDWIIRTGQDRALIAETSDAGAAPPLRDTLLNQPVLFTKTIQVRGRKPLVKAYTRGRRQPRESREAKVAVRAARAMLHPPHRPDRTLPAVSVNVVSVREVNPPPGDEPEEWILVTSLPVDTIEQVEQVIQYYCVRWMIEVFFRVLKTGCRIESRPFEEIDELLSCLAVYLIVAWRTLYVCRLGRSCPDINCEVVFEPAEWKSVWKVVRREDPPREPPPLGVMVRLDAQLGGFVNRKRSDQPGPQTIWIGLQRMHNFALGWELFGPDSQARSKSKPHG